MKLKLAFIALALSAGSAMAQSTTAAAASATIGAAPQAGAPGSGSAKVPADKLFKAQADARMGGAAGVSGGPGKPGARPMPEPSKLSFKERKELLTSAAQKHLAVTTKAQKCFAAAKDDSGLRDCSKAQMADVREAFPREMRLAMDTEARHLMRGQASLADAAKSAALPASSPKAAEQKK